MENISTKPTVLIVDDERNFTESLQMAVDDAFAVSVAANLKKAREILKRYTPDVILLDVRLPDGEGIELLRDLKESAQSPITIVMTAYATVESAVTALKEGAVDYFTKPLDIEKLKRELGVYLENRTLHKKIDALDREIKKIVPPFITSGQGAMKAIVERVPGIAPLAIPVLLQGETGTGKEKLAQWIHQVSGLRGDLVTISCAAVPKEIFESELFGYTKGAFTGATSNKEGLIEKAEGGTLFLDEIGELSDDIQAKLLRVLENGAYFKLGDTRQQKANFRLITATHRHLNDPGSGFRQDLYYRINGIAFELPRLRDRKEDLPLLAAAFLNEANYAYNKNVKDFTKRAIAALVNHDWPGNVRELKWCIHRAVATAGSNIIDVDDLAINLDASEASKEAVETAENHVSSSLKDAVEDVEKQCIKKALFAAKNNKTEAARILGISVRQLHYKLDQYGL